MKITVGDETLEFRVEYGNGQKMSIQMDAFGCVVVKAPKGTSEEVILKGMSAHAVQLINKVKAIETRKQAPKDKVYLEGEMFLYLGKEYPIAITVDETIPQNEVDFDGKYLKILSKSDEEQIIKDSLKRFYIRTCKKLIQKRIAHFQSEFQVKPRSVDIVEFKNNWGTCNTERKLTFNYRLIMAPEEIIDYIVVHEMCHLVHMNHERSFWRLVGKILPDYEKRQNWLAIKSPTMTL